MSFSTFVNNENAQREEAERFRQMLLARRRDSFINIANIIPDAVSRRTVLA
jgi:hypothetical protein